MKQIESNLVCIEKDCRLNRIITNWNDLQIHYHYQHKVYSQDIFEKKVNLKLNQLNEKFRMQIEDSISEQIAIQEQQIQQRIKSLFQNFQKIYFQLLQDQFKIIEQQDRLSSNYSIESNLNKYIDIYYCQLLSPQQFQFKSQEEIKYQLNSVLYELMNFVDKVEQDYILKIKQSSNNLQNQQNDLHSLNQIQFCQNQNKVELNQYEYEYKYPHQQSHFDNYQIQQQDQGYQYIQNQQQLPLQQSEIEQTQQKQIQQQLQDQKSKEQLKKSEQQSYQQITQFPTTLINDDQDRIQFQLPSETQKNDLYLNQITQKQNYNTKDNPQYQNKQGKEEKQLMKQQNDQVQNEKIQSENNIEGKKFDITNSDKHLKYSQRFSQFSCTQEGMALVEGTFKLNDNAKVKFKFSERLDKILTASFGMINVDQQGYKIGTLNYCMDQSGLLYKNEKSTQGSLKIDLNQDYTLEYIAEKRLLSFRKCNNITEKLHFEESISGSFKFYVKLQGLQVQIIK